MTRRVNVALWFFALQFDTTRYRTNLRRLSSGPQWITVGHSGGIRFEYLRVLQFKFFIGMRWNRKDAGLKQIFPGVFQQTRVALAPDDLVVDAPGFLPGTDFANQSPVAFPNRKLGYGCLFGNGKEINTLERRISVVSEDLFNVSGGNLRSDAGVDLDRLHRQRSR